MVDIQGERIQYGQFCTRMLALYTEQTNENTYGIPTATTRMLLPANSSRSRSPRCTFCHKIHTLDRCKSPRFRELQEAADTEVRLTVEYGVDMQIEIAHRTQEGAKAAYLRVFTDDGYQWINVDDTQESREESWAAFRAEDLLSKHPAHGHAKHPANYYMRYEPPREVRGSYIVAASGDEAADLPSLSAGSGSPDTPSTRTRAATNRSPITVLPGADTIIAPGSLAATSSTAAKVKATKSAKPTTVDSDSKSEAEDDAVEVTRGAEHTAAGGTKAKPKAATPTTTAASTSAGDKTVKNEKTNDDENNSGDEEESKDGAEKRRQSDLTSNSPEAYGHKLYCEDCGNKFVGHPGTCDKVDNGGFCTYCGSKGHPSDECRLSALNYHSVQQNSLGPQEEGTTPPTSSLWDMHVRRV